MGQQHAQHVPICDVNEAVDWRVVSCRQFGLVQTRGESIISIISPPLQDLSAIVGGGESSFCLQCSVKTTDNFQPSASTHRYDSHPPLQPGVTRVQMNHLRSLPGGALCE